MGPPACRRTKPVNPKEPSPQVKSYMALFKSAEHSADFQCPRAEPKSETINIYSQSAVYAIREYSVQSVMPTETNQNTTQYDLFVSCSQGWEGLLQTELEKLAVGEVKPGHAGVYVSATLEQMYKICLWTRLATKVLLPLDSGPIETGDDVHTVASKVDWPSLMKPGASLKVDFIGTNDAVRNTQFGAQRVKDAVVDSIRHAGGERPNVEKMQPDVRIHARLHRDELHISIDLSGDSLHRRGYRQKQGGAPLKENLAAALLLRAGWPTIAEQGGALLDPMCGSGTLLIEGALIAYSIAPGLSRDKFGFECWTGHNADTWAQVVNDAKAIRDKNLQEKSFDIFGYDSDYYVTKAAEMNCEALGLQNVIHIANKPVEELKQPTHKVLVPGLVIVNPPYGERLGEVNELRTTYQILAHQVKQQFEGWTFAVFTSNPELAKETRLRANKKNKFKNGALPAELFVYSVLSADDAKLRKDKLTQAVQTDEDGQVENASGAWVRKNLCDKPLTEAATMVANRIKKNLKRLKKSVKQNNWHGYRVYDADMPEYSAAIDLYNDQVHIQEYAAPKTIDADKAEARFETLKHGAAVALQAPDNKLFVKTRKRNKGKAQYEKQTDTQGFDAERCIQVQEGNAKLWVNLQDYLDTGLFLDHRPLRMRIHKEATGKRFLNLFCYTATASVHAALGGATESVSVDMSNTYLEWADNNFRLNNVHLARHRLVRADCFDWLNKCREGFDLIMLDPPTFSNSKKMSDVLDIQKDQVRLISRCMDILNPGGTLYFSTNFRQFKLDEQISTRYVVENISAETIDEDFKGNPKIHYCWKIQH